MADESDLERTEPPSARRLEKAREDGQVPQSRELMAFMVMAAAAGGLWGMGNWFAAHAGGIVRHGLVFDRAAAFDPAAMTNALASLVYQGLTLSAPLFLLTIIAAVSSPLVLGGWLFAPKALAPDLGRMDPLRGMGRMFSVHSLGELVKAMVKAVLIGAIIYWVVGRQYDRLFALAGQPIETALESFAGMLLFATLAMVAGLAAIAAVDVPFQLWRYYRDLRMTRDELRQELKELEGDPQLKARIRSQQREMARKRMMAEVPKADVVVTNPTRFAVALKYESGRMGAPQVVAKGINLVAARIRELAVEHRVPVVEAPPVARALYRHAEVGDPVPASLYSAVAEVLAYVYRLNEHIAGRPGMMAPALPTAWTVPDGLDRGPVE